MLNNVTPNSNKDYLLYWMELGQGHLDEAINIATYLDDNDITKLALINKLNEIKITEIYRMINVLKKRKSITINCKIF